MRCVLELLLGEINFKREITTFDRILVASCVLWGCCCCVRLSSSLPACIAHYPPCWPLRCCATLTSGSSSMTSRMLLAGRSRAIHRILRFVLTHCSIGGHAWRGTLMGRMLSSTSKKTSDSFLSGNSGLYADQMFEQWSRDPKSVHASWAAYFRNIESGVQSADAFQPPPVVQARPTFAQPQHHAPAPVAESDSLGVAYLIRAYQVCPTSYFKHLTMIQCEM